MANTGSSANLGFVSLGMRPAGCVAKGADIENPDIAATARAMDVQACHMGELPGAVAGTLPHDGPALLDVVAARHELPMAPPIGPERIKSLDLSALRALVSRCGDGVVDLARTNLGRQ